jgi:hypothetical protein
MLELQEFGGSMTAMQLVHDLAGGQLRLRKQRGRAMAYIIMAASLNHAKQQRHTQLIILLLMWQKNGQSSLV